MKGKKSRDASSKPPGPFASLFASTENTRKPRKGGFLRGFARLVVVGTLLVGIVAIAGALFYGVKALTFDLDKLREVPERTIVYDRLGNELGHVSGHGANRRVVAASEVSPHFIEALLAREDSRFYDHGGVDYRGVARAVVRNLKARDMEQGASTLTMQLARNTFEMREKSLHRKLLEVAIAQRIERRFSKDEILGFYVNRIYFGSGLYGIERASQGFFMKPASDLSPGEGAILAGIIRGPSLLNPFRSLENAQDTRDEVLDRMVADGRITPEEKTAAQNEKIELRPPDKRLATGSYTLQTVFDLLNDYLEEPVIKTGGLRIYTTIDPSLQETAENALDGHLTKIESRSGFSHPSRRSHRKGNATRYLQGAVISLDNRSGAIRAMVGGRNFGDSSFNRVYQAQRQVGSTFKPFVYAVAMHRSGLLPGAYVSDDPIRLSVGDGPVWSPKNSDGTFSGLQPAAIGLIRSRNTMSVRVGQIAGLDQVRDMAKALKFGDIPSSPVVFLGAFETTPMTITSAYSTFPAGGVNYAPFLIEKIENRNSEIMYQRAPKGLSIFPDSVSWVTSDILGKVMDEGTGRAARSAGYEAPAYGKTGTTNDYKDAWFVGFSDKITTGVWVGLDQPKTIMNRGYGSTLALPIWTEVMKEAEKGEFAASAIPAPEGTQPTTLCRECGLLRGNRTRHPYQMNLPADMRPRATCRGHRMGLFTNRNGLPQAFPVPGDRLPQIPPPNTRDGESGVGRAIRGIGRWIFGGNQ
ncbi:MAG: PBP1A family penicillin-binding protein [Verrucomicrobiales bacterium]|nr:PBP1A family penicillin-binding protein [Verrucomicrobiales bacterium]